MNSMHERCRWLVPLLTLVCATLHAQTNTPPADRYAGFEPYDSTKFTMGAITIFDGKLAKDLHLDYSYIYKAPIDVQAHLNLNPDNEGFDPDASAEEKKTWLTWRNWKEITEHALPVITEPFGINMLAYLSRTVQNVAGYQSFQTYGRLDSLHIFPFGFVQTQIMGTGGPLRRDSIYGRHIWGYRYPPFITGSTTNTTRLPYRIAGESKYTMEAVSYKAKEDENSFNDLRKFTDSRIPDPANTQITSREIDHLIDLGVSLKIQPASLLDPLQDNDLIAYVLLYKRERATQGRDYAPSSPSSDCRCNFYSKVDSFAVTKAVYNEWYNRNRDTRTGYTDVQFTFDIRDLVRHGGSQPWSATASSDVYVGTTRVLKQGGTVESTPVPRDGSWFDWLQGAPTTCSSFCQNLYTTLDTQGLLPPRTINLPVTVENGDIYYDVHTTSLIPINFLKGRIGSHVASLVREGVLDPIIHDALDPIFVKGAYDSDYKKNLTDSVISRVGTIGESQLHYHYAEGPLRAEMMRYMLQKSKETEDEEGRNVNVPPRQLYSNLIGEDPTYRLMSGDLDTTAVRIMQVDANQIYPFGREIPITYANPLKMSAEATKQFYRTEKVIKGGVCTTCDYVDVEDHQQKRPRWIMGNRLADLAYYDSTRAWRYDSRRTGYRMAVETARERFLDGGYNPYPVWGSVQIHGWLGFENDVNHRGYFANDWRPTTPEEITGQSWLALNCGLDGIYFSDFIFDGAEFGVVHKWELRSDSTGPVGDYAALYVENPRTAENLKDASLKMPLMWTGFDSRLNAIKSITSTFHTTILPVYNKLDRNGVHFSLNHGQSYDTIPLLSEVLVEQADPASGSTVGPGGVRNFGPYTSRTLDAADKAYMDVTVFKPLPRHESEEGFGPDTRYVLFTNLRAWPVDFDDYTHIENGQDTVKRLFTALAEAGTEAFSQNGLGSIDVRRPRVKFKSTDVMVDHVMVQRVGSQVSTQYPVNTEVALDWLNPGEGAMYRVTPVYTRVATFGTAYNNAVHAENPSTQSAGTLIQNDRIVVYERDSAIYLRTMSPSGGWSIDHLISPSADNVFVNGVRVAYNMHPAMATVRDGSSCMIVWERRTANNRVSLESVRLPIHPTRDVYPASGDIISRQLMKPRQFTSGGTGQDADPWEHLAPAIAGLDGGYLVSWTPPDKMVELKAIRDDMTATGIYDTSRVLRVAMPATPQRPLDSAAKYSTLAHRRNLRDLVLNGGKKSPGEFDGPWPILYPTLEQSDPIVEEMQLAHLAYQQGSFDNSRWVIMYNQIGVKFPAGNVFPEVWASPTEEVTRRLTACSFRYPSIAADSAHVGVTFTIDWGVRHVALMFRAEGEQIPTAWRWNTPEYRWGGRKISSDPPKKIISDRRFQRSSLTLFPSRYKKDLSDHYEGMITWEWANPPGSRGVGQKVYRLGEYDIDSIPDGRHPTMVLAPYISLNAAAAMAATSVYHRGPDASGFLKPSPINMRSTRYYPGYLRNTPDNPLPSFKQPSHPTNKIYASYDLANAQLGERLGCGGVDDGGGIGLRIGVVTHPPGPPTPPTTPPDPPYSPFTVKVMTAPPTFFQTGARTVSTLSEASEIARTGVFSVADSVVPIRRLLYGYGDVGSWLDAQPYDPAMHRAGDVIFTVQVIRASDSALLWEGDTISARTIGNDTLDESVAVPVGQVASPGTEVYLRIGATATAGFQYDLGSSFEFIDADDDDTTGGSGGTGGGGTGGGGTGGGANPKPVREAVPGIAPDAGLTVLVRPTPVAGETAYLQVSVPRGNEVTIDIYDALGRPAADPQRVELARSGSYSLPLRVGTLPAGSYSVVIRSGTDMATTRLQLVR